MSKVPSTFLYLSNDGTPCLLNQKGDTPKIGQLSLSPRKKCQVKPDPGENSAQCFFLLELTVKAKIDSDDATPYSKCDKASDL